ncbi:hypothetical protein I0E51_03420 [Pseudomonas lalucatii]|nr:hypothetical protein [Pseudomonas lalucatii]
MRLSAIPMCLLAVLGSLLQRWRNWLLGDGPLLHEGLTLLLQRHVAFDERMGFLGQADLGKSSGNAEKPSQ